MENFIHPSSVIGPDVVLDEGCHIGPFCVIEGDVHIQKNTRLHSHVSIIGGKVRIGENNTIYPFVSIGGIPQDLTAIQPGGVTIGSGNRIWQGVTIHSSASEENFTVIGNNNFIMTQVHIAHDCVIKNNIILTALTGLAGHVIIDDYAIIGGMTGIVQKLRIGAHAFTVGQSRVTTDIFPYMLFDQGIRGVNLVGLRRRGFSKVSISALMKFAKDFREQNDSPENCLQKIKDEFGHLEEIKVLEDFFQNKKNS